jgi:hypothetical protein
MTQRRAGYPGSLPPRGDVLGGAWALAVVGIFVAIIILSLLGLPSGLVPEPTPSPLPSLPLPVSPSPLP